MIYRARACLFLALACTGVALAACGSGTGGAAGSSGLPASPDSPIPLVTPGVAGVTPGHGSPAGAVAGFLDAAALGQVGVLCSYVAPQQQAACPAAFNQVTIGPQGAPVRLGMTYTLGNQALVVPLGTICTSGVCSANDNPRLGLPADDAGFGAAFLAATTTDIMTQPCEEVAGQWYVLALGLPTPPAA